MTEKEIVQALRCCESGIPCTRCQLVSNKNCVNVMHKREADLIERLTAENAALREKQTSINIYFDYEDATPDDAGSDCVTNWNYFSRHYTCIEAERAMEG